MIDIGSSEAVKNILSSSHLEALLDRGGWVLQLIYSLVTLGSLVALIINITKLGASGGNPMARNQAMRNILISSTCLTVLGALGTIYAIFVGFII